MLISKTKIVRWNIKEVEKYVELNSECELISKKYVNTKSKMEFKCECGEIFQTSFEKFRLRNKRQCNSCGYIKGQSYKRNSYLEVKTFVEENSECELLSREYFNNRTPLKLLCGCGNTFKTNYDKFKSRNKRQCNTCSRRKIAESQLFTHEEVKKYMQDYGVNLITKNYSGCEQLLEIECGCGEIYSQTFSGFKTAKFKKCPTCRNGMSAGEQLVESILRGYKIKYTKQKTFADLTSELSNHNLRYDFCVMVNDKKYLIEYDGRQHYEPIEWFGGEESFARQQINDSLKNNFAKDKNIPLLRIPYWIEDDETKKKIIDFLQLKNKAIPSQA